MATLQTVETRATGNDFPTGKAYFEKSTKKFIVWNGSSWLELDSDGVGAYSFNISVYSTEQAVADIGLTNTITEGDLVYAQETDSLYVANADTNWLKFTYDS
ncbi:MAG: hypothetical protein ACPH3C_05585 [Glaciecola sp.]